MSIPSPWVALILLAGSYRIWRLLAEDTILDRPRRWVVGLPPNWKEGMLLPEGYRYKLAELINCPWCLGFYATGVVWLCWEWQPHWTLVVLTPFALSAGMGITRGKLDPPE